MVNLILFPFLLAFFPSWVFILKNIDEIIIQDIIISLGIVLISITLWLIVRKILKNSNKSALIVAFGILIFFYFGYIQDGLEDVIDNDIKTSFLGIAATIVFIIFTAYIIKSKRIFDTIIKIANFAVIILILVVLVEIIPIANAEKPNIYHLILDEYTDQEILDKKFGHDNQEFYDLLNDYGFIIPEKSFSVFDATDSELVTILNFNYPNTKDGISTYENYELLKDNNVMKKLSDEQYHIIETNSMMRWKDFKHVDEKICYNTNLINSEFFEQVLNKSIIRYFLEKYQENSRRDTIRCTFDELNKITIAKYEKPIYVFSHIYVPHPPFLFDSNGNDVSPKHRGIGGLQSWEDPEGYINQFIYATKEIKQIIENIEKNDSEAIVILQGDTGTSTGLKIRTNLGMNEIYQKHSNFYALKIPKLTEVEMIYPVNTYRIIFNNYFDTKYEYLEEKIFVPIKNENGNSVLTDVSKTMREFNYQN
jgi:hypothetical protein